MFHCLTQKSFRTYQTKIPTMIRNTNVILNHALIQNAVYF